MNQLSCRAGNGTGSVNSRSPTHWYHRLPRMPRIGELQKKKKNEKPSPYENSLYNFKVVEIYKIATWRKRDIFGILKHPNLKTYHLVELIEPGSLLLSIFHEDVYFWRNFRYWSMCLVRGRGEDWGAGRGKGTDG